MAGGRDYDIFPRTFLPRLLLGLAFAGGLVAIGLYVALVVFWDDLASELIDLPPCSEPEREGCLNVQAELVPLSHEDCPGWGRRICFAPIGQVDPQLVRDLVRYYDDEYGLQIGVLTPSAIPDSFIDPERQQLDVSAMGELIGHVHWLDVESPNVVLIALTPVDIYDRNSHYRFLFGIKGDYAEPTAVVSTYRMHLGRFRLVDEELVFERTRKMVTKYIGLLYYGLEESDEAASPMFGNILSLSDLDRMEEPLPIR